MANTKALFLLVTSWSKNNAHTQSNAEIKHMKTILVNKWHERAFEVEVRHLKSERETAREQIRVALGILAKRQLHAASRTVRKTLRAAEVALWQATGGDSLQLTTN